MQVLTLTFRINRLSRPESSDRERLTAQTPVKEIVRTRKRKTFGLMQIGFYYEKTVLIIKEYINLALQTSHCESQALTPRGRSITNTKLQSDRTMMSDPTKCK